MNKKIHPVFTIQLKSFLLLVFILVINFSMPSSAGAQDDTPLQQHLVEPGDTWSVLAWRFGIPEVELRMANPHPNNQRMPAIGSFLSIPANGESERTGRILRTNFGGLLQAAVLTNRNGWEIALLNRLESPFRPLFYREIFVPSPAEIPRDYPVNISMLEVSSLPAYPGQALGFRGTRDSQLSISAALDGITIDVFQNESHIVGLVGTGAFYPPGDHALDIVQDGLPLWSQPWRMVEGDWTFEQITLTGSAAAIDQQTIRIERERLQAIWSQVALEPQWSGPFELPLADFLSFSSFYGARRSYNGGPFSSYHEGLDFSAYGGTPVYAPARGRVVLAEFLDVRGGSVIIDHGFGIHSGTYHMSEILVSPGDMVEPKQEVGKVGSTGLSTGNHLHWDLLIQTTWIDPATWVESDFACWLSSGYGQPCG